MGALSVLRGPTLIRGGARASLASILLGKWADTNGGITIVPQDDSIRIIDPTVPSNNYGGSLNEYLRTRSFTTAQPAPKLTLQSDGVYRYQPHNLLAMSERFDSAYWSVSDAAVSGGFVDYSGSSTAFKLAETTANSPHFIVASFSGALAGATYTLSFDLKAAERTVACVYAATVNQGKYFDLSTGTVGGNLIAAPSGGATITALANGWYRCSITVVSPGSSIPCRVYVAQSDGVFSYTGTLSSGVLVARAQLNLGTEATTYVKTDVHNLCLRSQEFDNASWLKSFVSVTTNAETAPDGTLTAERVAYNNTAYPSVFQNNVAVTAGVAYTYSNYIKAGNQSVASLELRMPSDAGLGPDAIFDVSGTGSVTAVASDSTAGVEFVGNGWCRCWITKTAPATGNATAITGAQATITTGAATVSGSTLHLFGAQVNLGTTPGKYSATTTAAVYESHVTLPYEWDASGNALGVDIEEARTNLCLHSQDFTNAAWNTGTLLVSTAQSGGPNGGATFNLVTENGAGAIFSKTNNVTVVSGSTYTSSYFMKRGNFDWIRITAAADSTYANGVRVWFNLQTGARGTTAALGTGWTHVNSGIDALPNGIYRIWVTYTTGATTLMTSLISASADNSTTRANVGSGAGIGGQYLATWAQDELGSFASSPIPTTSAAVTRAADNVSLATSLFPVNSAAFTLFGEFSLSFAPVSGLARAYLLDLDDAGNDRLSIRAHDGSAVNPSYVYGSGSTLANFNGASISANAACKSALAADATGGAAYQNATQINTSAVVAGFGTAGPLGIGQSVSASNRINGHVRRIMFIPRRMSNADLQALTT